MALDDDAQIDPATRPENIELMQMLDALNAPPDPEAMHAPAEAGMRLLMVEALEAASAALPENLAARGAPHPLEEDLRSALAGKLAKSKAAVFTESKLQMPGWSPNLGGFDISVVGSDGAIVLVETKWGDVWQSVWDVLKLASAHRHPRIAATYAVYAATTKDWARWPSGNLFTLDSKACDTSYLLEEYQQEWQWNRAGSPNVHVTQVPDGIGFKAVHATAIDYLGSSYEIRTIAVSALPGALLDLSEG